MEKENSKVEIKKVSPKMQAFEEKVDNFTKDGYIATPISIDQNKLNSRSALLAIPIVVAFLLIFFKVHKDYVLKPLFNVNFALEMIILLFILFLITGIYELIKALSFSILAKKSINSVKFGIVFSPMRFKGYIEEPIERKQYIIAMIIPMIILGIIPVWIGFLLPNHFILLGGLMIIANAIADVMLISLLKHYKTETDKVMVLTYPEETGMVVLEKSTKSSGRYKKYKPNKKTRV